jgi:SAM-dependent methyltransferase
VRSNTQRNLALLDQLALLFGKRAARPDDGWPDFNAYLDENRFPSSVLTEELLAASLEKERVARIAAAIAGNGSDTNITVHYRAPWSDPRVLNENSVDLIISHSVLEHVVDLEGTYRALYQWLKPGGWMSHQVDLRSHGLSRRWNGHLACSDLVWKMTMGRRMFMINRCLVSEHLRLIERAGFQVVTQDKHLRDDGIRRDELAPRWGDISDEDLNCSGLYVIARK